MKILIAEDDQETGAYLRKSILAEGHMVGHLRSFFNTARATPIGLSHVRVDDGWFPPFLDAPQRLEENPLRCLGISGRREIEINRVAELMTSWLTAGVEFDAVLSNNDEMALGAIDIQALKNSGIDMDKMVIGGIAATADAVATMQAGRSGYYRLPECCGLGTWGR